MVNNQIILSICIATYNRANYIGHTLESLIPQLNDNVEIIIVDGASTDETENVIAKYILVENRIRYYKLDKKGGVDQDYDKALSFANGSLCWLFTDDDIAKPNAIQSIISNYIKNKFCLIILNAETRDKELSNIITERLLNFNENKIYKPIEFEDLFVETIDYLSFIGCVVIEKSMWFKRNRINYYGTEFIHVGVIFQNLLPSNCLVISEPLISIRLDNAQWTSRSFEIWIIKWPKLLNSFSNLRNNSKLKYSLLPSFRRLRNIFVQRSNHSYNFNLFKKWFWNSNEPIWWKFILFFISIFPIYFSKKIVKSFLDFKYILIPKGLTKTKQIFKTRNEYK